jgi:hypothetical protein
MRRVAFATAGVVFRHLSRRIHMLFVSGAVVGLMSLWRAAAAVISDMCANVAQEHLNGFAGRVGEWLIIAAVLSAYAWRTRRRRRREAVAHTAAPIVRSIRTVRIPHMHRAHTRRTALRLTPSPTAKGHG